MGGKKFSDRDQHHPAARRRKHRRIPGSVGTSLKNALTVTNTFSSEPSRFNIYTELA